MHHISSEERARAPLVILGMSPVIAKYRWRPLYGLVQGIQPGAWVRVRFPTSDDRRKARTVLREVAFVSFVEGLLHYRYQTALADHACELWIRKIER